MILYLKSQNAWVVEFTDSEGKSRRQKVRGIRDQESRRPIPSDVLDSARSYMDSRKLEVEAEKPVASTSLANIANTYIEHYMKIRRPTSTEFLKRIIKSFMEFTGNIDIHQINRSLIQKYFHHRLESGTASPQTVIQQLHLLSVMFSHCVDLEILEVNPVKLSLRQLRSAYPPPHKNLKFLEINEIKKLIAAIETDRQTGRYSTPCLEPVIDLLPCACSC